MSGKLPVPAGLKKAKRVKRGEYWTSGPAVLYLDDVETIYGLCTQASSTANLRLDGYELGSPADAAQLEVEETRDLKVSISAPFAHIEPSWSGFGIWVSDAEDLVLVGLTRGCSERSEEASPFRGRGVWDLPAGVTWDEPGRP